MAFCAHAADPFSEIVDRITDANLSLKSEHLRLNASIEEMKADNMLADPEVEFERLWHNGGGDNRWSLGVSQSFDWPGLYSARRRAINARSAAAAAISDDARRQCRRQVAQLLIELITTGKEISTLTEIHSSMLLLQEKYQRAWEMGETTILDVNKLKIEAIRSATRLEEARSNYRTLEAELRGMAETNSGGTDLSFTELQDLPMLELHSMEEYLDGMESSPEIKALNLMSQAADAASSVSKASMWPGFSIGYAHAYEDGSHFNGLTVGMSLPIYSRRHLKRSAEAEAMAAHFDAVARTNELSASLRADYTNALSLKEQMDQYGPILDGFNHLTLLRKALDGGELTLLQYIQETNYFVEARLDYLTIAREYAATMVSLNSYLPAVE